MCAAYLAAFGFLVTAPFTMPEVGRLLGLTVLTGRRAAWHDTLAVCGVFVALFGCGIAYTLGMRKHWLAWVVGCSVPLLVVFVVGPALGR